MAESPTDPQSVTCYWHPEVPTGLSCSQCRRPICTQCLVQVPVGIRCRECGRAQPLPTFDVRPSNYARAAVVAAIVAVAGIVLTVLLTLYLGGLAFIIMPLGVGYVAGELISRVVNLKRSRGLMYIAGGTVVLSIIVSILLLGIPLQAAFSLIGLWGVLAIVGGVFIAIARVRL